MTSKTIHLKNKISLGILVLLLLFLKTGIAQKRFSVTNDLPEKRTDALVILQRKDVGKMPDSVHSFLRIKDELGKMITVQQDDLDGDGRWDEAVFLYTFLPQQKLFFTIGFTGDKPSSKAISRAHVRMKHKNTDDSFGPTVLKDTMPFNKPPTDFGKNKLPPYLTEGPAWENDKVAFRQYFDLRNTKDIYGKIVSGMVMDTVGANPQNSYHKLSDWGMDILHVVKSLGAGSIAIATGNENNRDTLIRLGGKDILQEVFEQVADGPVRAIFKMSYQWKINNKPVTVIEETTISGGQYFYETAVTITGVTAGAKLVVGIADFYENTTNNFISQGAAVSSSYGAQSENKDLLGMAVMVPKKSFSWFKEAPKSGSDITETHLIAQQIKNGIPLRYRFYTCWEKTDQQFMSADYFKRFLEKEAAQFSSALKVKWD